jgi:hypothetical protein
MSPPLAGRAVVTTALAVFGTACAVAVAGPAAAIPFEGDPDAAHCVRLVHRQTLWPAEAGLTGYVGVPLVAILVPRADC